MLISQALEIFIGEKIMDGCEKSTLENYRRMIGFFIDYHGDKELDTVNKDVIKEYQGYLLTKQGAKSFGGNQPTISRTTVRTYMTHIRSYFNYLYLEEYMETKVFERVKLPKQKRKEIEILSLDEIQRLWTYFRKTESGVRYRCFVCLLLDTGIRRSEAIGLSINDISLEKAEIILRDTKSGHERIVPMGHLTRQYLFRYLNKHRYLATVPEDPLFTMSDGTAMTDAAIKSLFMRLKKHLNRRVYPHLLRHTFATLYLIEYGDIYELKRILGHHDIAMVNKYLQMANRIKVKDRSLMDNISRTRVLASLKPESTRSRKDQYTTQPTQEI